jgi:hypothetical protein
MMNLSPEPTCLIFPAPRTSFAAEYVLAPQDNPISECLWYFVHKQVGFFVASRKYVEDQIELHLVYHSLGCSANHSVNGLESQRNHRDKYTSEHLSVQDACLVDISDHADSNNVSC